MKLVFSLKQPPEHRQAQPERFDRIPNPNRSNWDISVAIFIRKDPQICAALPIMAIGHGNMPLGRLIAAQQPHSINQSRQRPRRKGPARIANQKDLIARLIAARQSAIDLLNLEI
jgi:hypothetical protein